MPPITRSAIRLSLKISWRKPSSRSAPPGNRYTWICRHILECLSASGIPAPNRFPEREMFSRLHALLTLYYTTFFPRDRNSEPESFVIQVNPRYDGGRFHPFHPI